MHEDIHNAATIAFNLALALALTTDTKSHLLMEIDLNSEAE